MTHRILAIDPGNTHTGWVIINAHTRQPLQFGKSPNPQVLGHCWGDLEWDTAAIEMVASYGMAVGKEVFETCVWIGRYLEAATGVATQTGPELIYRRDIKLHHCHSARAKDSNIRQALVDRFAPGQPNHGKGTKAAPGWFYGFRADVWQAYALAVYIADQTTPQAAAAPPLQASLI
ncbi:hypothetical protein [Nocardioides massiliensis]|uniref:Uncharacterized protein n=1 Tax=Nocardioides massiliensis TaxID=1325935 RepID=A0ABT9NJK8_9ACTN|nr:hypothetical protein [Nocardioides massiliensis]MDP9820409.1 hypothetical protein [Nocardioides massiliensis]